MECFPKKASVFLGRNLPIAGYEMIVLEIIIPETDHAISFRLGMEIINIPFE